MQVRHGTLQDKNIFPTFQKQNKNPNPKVSNQQKIKKKSYTSLQEQQQLWIKQRSGVPGTLKPFWSLELSRYLKEKYKYLHSTK